MQEKDISILLTEWTDEINSALLKNETFCVAVFSTDRELLFANNSMTALFKGEPADSLLNPSFDTLLEKDATDTLIFEGFLTLGDFFSVNTSIWTQAYRKKDKILIVGGVNAVQLLEQNEIMHQLNREINNLQRELIKEKHKLENTLAQLNQTNQKLHEVNATKDQFISILGHDLKNPFTTLLGFSNLLITRFDQYDRETIKRHLETINKTSSQIYNLLNNLLEWSRIQGDKVAFNPETTNIYLLVQETYDLFTYMAKAKQITIEMDVAEDIEVQIDREMIKTVIRNLLNNAIKFTPEDGKINISATKKEAFVHVKVSDTGAGMKQKTLNKLFKIGEIESRPGTDGERGTGFGLLLCKEFIDKHGGEIWAESEVGKGSSFKFTIPRNITA